MPKVAKFNPYVILNPHKPARPTCSWWMDLRRDPAAAWYARAKTEFARMNRTGEAASLHPRCLDDL